jgi:hypothetical protein
VPAGRSLTSNGNGHKTWEIPPKFAGKIWENLFEMEVYSWENHLSMKEIHPDFRKNTLCFVVFMVKIV